MARENRSENPEAAPERERKKTSFKGEEIILEIDPRLSVPSGTHPTTTLCMEMIENYLAEGDTLLDVGTGSGILMITAAKLGAEKVSGIDRNRIAVELARKNLFLNNIEERKFKVVEGNLLEGIEECYDLVVVNILPEVILALLEDIRRVLTETGILICSGMLEGNTHRVTKKMGEAGFEILETLTRNKWVSIAGRQGPGS